MDSARTESLRTLLQELEELPISRLATGFTPLFRRGCELLDINDEEAARRFDTSVPNVRRWREGKALPPVGACVLLMLYEELQKIESIG